MNPSGWTGVGKVHEKTRRTDRWSFSHSPIPMEYRQRIQSSSEDGCTFSSSEKESFIEPQQIPRTTRPDPQTWNTGVAPNGSFLLNPATVSLPYNSDFCPTRENTGDQHETILPYPSGQWAETSMMLRNYQPGRTGFSTAPYTPPYSVPPITDSTIAGSQYLQTPGFGRTHVISGSSGPWIDPQVPQNSDGSYSIPPHVGRGPTESLYPYHGPFGAEYPSVPPGYPQEQQYHPFLPQLSCPPFQYSAPPLLGDPGNVQCHSAPFTPPGRQMDQMNGIRGPDPYLTAPGRLNFEPQVMMVSQISIHVFYSQMTWNLF